MYNYKNLNYGMPGRNKQDGEGKSFFRKGKDGEVYSAQEMEKLIAENVEEALKNARTAWDKENESKIAAERDDAARLASMSAEERAKAELDKRESAFAQEKQRYMSERMEFEATKALADEQLPVSFAKILAGADESETKANIEMFRDEFYKALEQALNDRLKGRTPKTSSVVESSDPFLAGFGM